MSEGGSLYAGPAGAALVMTESNSATVGDHPCQAQSVVAALVLVLVGIGWYCSVLVGIVGVGRWVFA